MKKKKNKKKLILHRFIIALAILIFIIFGIVKAMSSLISNLFSNSSNQTITKTQEEKYTDLTLSVVGDLMMHSPQAVDGLNNSTGEYDFSHCFEPIKKYLNTDGLTIGNLETPIAGPQGGYNGYPLFNAPDVFAKNLKDAGFDILTTANNHSIDQKVPGINNTLDILDTNNIEHTGTARSQEERDKILIVEKNNISIAMLAYTYGTNGNPIPSRKRIFCEFNW